MPRKYIDFRYFDQSCTLAISGTEEELLDLAVLHASTVHGFPNTLELREKIRLMLKDEAEVKAARARTNTEGPWRSPERPVDGQLCAG